MKCNFCTAQLHPMMLRQAIRNNEEVYYDVECINPSCMKHNYVSQEFYFRIRDDYLPHYAKPLNNKLPSDMNVIFVSLQRHGISWVIRNLSNFHKYQFGKPIIFTPKNAEISTVNATRNRRPLPQGWNNVYNVDPQALVDKVDPEGKQYDRVVLIQKRDYEDLYDDMIKYWSAQGLYSELIEKHLSELPKAYEKQYGMEDPDDPRFMRVYLEDLNNKTYDTFNRLMDFLNYPTYKRCPPVAVRTITRDWSVYSSVLEKEESVCRVLAKIEKMEIEKNDELKVLVLGPRIHKGVHFSENIYYAFEKLGHKTQLLPCEALTDSKEEYNWLRKKKEMYPISKVIEKSEFTPTLIVVDESAFLFHNDTTVPLFYVHREFKRQPSVIYPDVAFFWHQGVINYFDGLFAPLWCHLTKHLFVLSIATDLEKYQPKEKTIKGIKGVGGRERFSSLVMLPEITAQGILYESVSAHEEVKEYIEIIGGDSGISDELFRETLLQMEAIWCHIPVRQYTSRRMLEAMACKTLVVMKLENREHEKILEQMGLYRDVHYIGLDAYSELKGLNDCFKYGDWTEMVKKAYEVVCERHTYEHRAKELIEMWKRFGK